ncbi:MAG TPA: hypothetical protein VEJ84_15545 [Acidimicrobiales bacterium]|nr:hypothetical protein [Acidimicrobiales bacterium]
MTVLPGRWLVKTGASPKGATSFGSGPVVAALAAACGVWGVVPAAASLASYHRPGPAVGAGRSYTCVATASKAMVDGDPDVSFVPPMESVSLVPTLGGLVVEYRFRSDFGVPPEGVYFSWTVYIYAARKDANLSTRGTELQVEDRGAGWEASGWAVLVATYTSSSPVEGVVRTDKAHDALSVFFPPGFANLSPPFYWFATQEEYRAYLPEANRAHPRDWSVFGSVSTDCPVGVRANINSLPSGLKLLAVAA